MARYVVSGAALADIFSRNVAEVDRMMNGYELAQRVPDGAEVRFVTCSCPRHPSPKVHGFADDCPIHGSPAPRQSQRYCTANVEHRAGVIQKCGLPEPCRFHGLPPIQHRLDGGTEVYTTPVTRKLERSIQVERVLSHYRGWRPTTRFGDPARKRVLARINEGFSVEDLCKAVDGCFRSPWHVERGQIGTDLIFRSAEKVNFFVARADAQVTQDKTWADQALREAALLREGEA